MIAVLIHTEMKKPGGSGKPDRVNYKDKGIMQPLSRFGNIVSTVSPEVNPNYRPCTTDCMDVQSYIKECRERQRRGWPANHARNIAQQTEAYLLGLSNERPHEGEQYFEHFQELRPEPFTEHWQNRFLATCKANPDFCKAFSAIVRRGVKS